MAALGAAQRLRFFDFHTVPPAPPFPEEIHLRKVCGIVWCVDASDESAEEAMAPMLSVAEPLMHGVGRMPLKESATACSTASTPPGDQWYWRGDFFDAIPDEAIRQNREWNDRMPSSSAVRTCTPSTAPPTMSRPKTRRSHSATRPGRRYSSPSTPTRPGGSAIRDWTIGYWEALHPYSAGGGYVNFLMEEDQARVKATYGPNYERLAQVKAAYDPDNVFRINQNIPPAP